MLILEKNYQFLFLLISTDVVFIVVHVIFISTGWLSSTNFSIELDRG